MSKFFIKYSLDAGLDEDTEFFEAGNYDDVVDYLLTKLGVEEVVECEIKKECFRKEE